MKISIITATYNSAATIRDTMESVRSQNYPWIEHIIIDGGSKDETIAIAGEYPHVIRLVSEKDEGLYDAINKGIRLSTGDVVGILNSDDFFPSPKILSTVAKAFHDDNIDAVFGDIAFVSPDNLDKIVRHYSSKNFHPRKFPLGYMPAHPSFYVRKKYYEKYGLYQLGYKIAADFELLMRFMHANKLRTKYLPMIFVHMRTGGISNKNILSRYTLNREIVRACGENGVKTNMFRISLKYFKKIFEFVLPGLRVKRQA